MPKGWHTALFPAGFSGNNDYQPLASKG